MGSLRDFFFAAGTTVNKLTIPFSVVPQGSGSTYYFGQYNGDVQVSTSRVQTLTLDRGDGTTVTKNLLTGARQTIFESFPDGTQREMYYTFPDAAAVTELIIIRGRVQGTFTDKISQLVNLEYLDLRSNDITSFPTAALSLTKLKWLSIAACVNISALPTNIDLLEKLETLSIQDSSLQTLPTTIGNLPLVTFNHSGFKAGTFVFPATFNSRQTLKTLQMVGGVGQIGRYFGDAIPDVIKGCTSLEVLRAHRTGLNNIAGIESLINLKEVSYGGVVHASGNLPANWKNLVKLKTIVAANMFDTQAKMDAHVNDYYAVVAANAPMVGINTDAWRGVSLNISNNQTGFNGNPKPSGTYQQPAGYVQGSSNGTPASPQEKIWVLVNQYNWTVLTA